MTDPIIYAGAAVTVIAALAAGVVSVINALATIKKKTDAISEKANAISEKATQIHDLANSQLTSVTASLAIANEKIIGLEKLLAAMVEGGTSRERKLDAIESISKDSNGILHKPAAKKR